MNTVKWKLDLAHSEMTFKVKHLLISTVTGRFNNFDVELETENEEFVAASRIVFVAEVNSIDTNNPSRDTHLKSEEFFFSEKYRQIIFTADQYSTLGSENALYGQLTIRGVQRPVKVMVEFGGLVIDPYGQTKVGFSVSGKINRKDFGLIWNALTESGGAIVSDEVRFHGEIQLVKQST
jgi:polyisoprenoid-binding protein YceI